MGVCEEEEEQSDLPETHFAVGVIPKGSDRTREE